MNHSKITKACLIAAAIVLLAVFVAAPAGARGLDKRLYGDYDYNVAATCVNASCGPVSGPYDCQSNPGFDPGTLKLLAPQKSSSYNLHGVIHFDGHGKFTFKGEGLANRLSPNPSPFDVPANQFDLSCSGIYRVDSEGNELFVDLTFPLCTATVKSGLFVGYTQTLSGSTTVRGRLDTVNGGNAVIIRNSFPYIEELETIAPPAFAGLKEQRICNNTGSMVKLLPWRYWFLND